MGRKCVFIAIADNENRKPAERQVSVDCIGLFLTVSPK